MSVTVHPSAVVEDGAELGTGVVIGPFCCVGPHVRLGDNVTLHSHVVIAGRTTIGSDCAIFPFASIGMVPQDLKFRDEPSQLIIGRGNRIREYVTINPGTAGGGMTTRIGDHCLFMINAHVAHDCLLGDHVILSNNATLAGHVTIGDFAILGGLSAVHQFVRIGAHAMIGGMSGVEHDVIPFGLVMGERARLSGLNLIGLERRGFSRDDIRTLRAAYRMLFAPEGTLMERLDEVANAYGGHRHVDDLLVFLREKTSRSITQPRV